MGLTGRILLASTLVGLVLAASFTTLLLSIEDSRSARDEATHVSDVLAGGRTLEKLMLDLERGLRGFLVTRDDRFLDPYEGARRAYPAESRRLGELITVPAQDELLAAIDRSVEGYIREYAEPLIREARNGLFGEDASRATRHGKRRVDRIGQQFARFRAAERQLVVDLRRRADRTTDRTVLFALIGLALSVLLLAAYATYLVRLVVYPVVAVAGAARGLAEGHASTRVPEGGTAEVSELGRAFNKMAESLDESRENMVNTLRRVSEREEINSAVLDATPDPIGLFDRDGTPLLENPPMRTLRERLDEPVYRADPTERDKPARDELEVTRLERTFIRYRAPVREAIGKRKNELVVLRDVTSEREAERQKDEFFALISHELRTPLTAIVGYIEILLEESGDDAASARRKEMLEIVERNSSRLRRLLGDLLFAAEIETGKFTLDRSRRVDLATIAEEGVAAASPRADDRGVALELSVDPVPEIVGDPQRLAQAIDNLVSNAIKFTPAGGRVTVSVGERDGRAVVTVEDTGVGIPAADQDRLFARFFRASNAVSEAIPGVGLGLTIAKAIVEGHGGNISLESEEGRGTTFRIEIPLDER